MGLGTLFNWLLQDSDCWGKNFSLSRWLNPICGDAFKAQQSLLCSVCPKGPRTRPNVFLCRRLGMTFFQLPGASHAGLSLAFELPSQNNWGKFAVVRHPASRAPLPPLPHQWSLLKIAALFVAFCLWINESHLAVTYSLSHTSGHLVKWLVAHSGLNGLVHFTQIDLKIKSIPDGLNS